MSVTIAISLDTRRVKRLNKYPLKLRVTYQRITEYYQTIFDISSKDWAKLSASRITGELQAIRNELEQIESDAIAGAKKINPFNFQDFERSVVLNNSNLKQRQKKIKARFENSSEFDFDPFYKRFSVLREKCFSIGTIGHAYQSYIKKLLQEGRIGSASNYHCSYISLKKFRGNVCFNQITVSYLYEYENWMKDKNASKTTIGIYLRPLRAIFNEAIKDKIIFRDNCYPFGLRNYIIPSSKKVKKALPISDIQKIYIFRSKTDVIQEQQAIDYWLFSYLGNGMNPKDIANLKFKNIDGDYLAFERAKTQRTQRSDPKLITVYLGEDMRTIIDRWGNKNFHPNNFIFPILEQGLSSLRSYDLVKGFVRFINDWMKVIVEKAGIDKRVTTYVARHTFSTVLKRGGASTEFIQESLGHSDIKTTEYYLDSFERETTKEFASLLTAFKSINQIK